MNKVEIAELLRAFIADEDAGFAAGGNGKLWIMKHHLIGPVMSKAEKVLEPEERARLYFHFMRRSGTALPAVPASDFANFVAAYDLLLPHVDNPKVNSTPRHVLLYIFGYDDTGVLDAGKGTAQEWPLRLAFVKKAFSFTNLFGMRQKAGSFKPFVDEAPRMLETLRHLDYRHDRRYEGEPDYDGVLYDVTNFGFWGMVMVLVLNRATRDVVKADFVSKNFNDLPQRDRQRETFARFLAEV